MVWSQQHLVTRGGVTYLLTVSLGVLLACGLGFWWLEPTTPTLADGMWLAFTTAATVGYGDIVPTTHWSKAFAVAVVLLGLAVLSLVTASVAAMLVEVDEREMDDAVLKEIRHLRADLHAMQAELKALRQETRADPG